MDDATAREVRGIFRRRAEPLGIPGATLGIDDGEGIREFALGVLNLETGVETTTDSLFQIGSVTKLLTATLTMQLVDEGLVELDAPASAYLPGLRFGEGCTVRQLLTHTSGVDGDFVEDFGRGDDAIERYVDACADLEQVAPPGRFFSYCNAGFVVLGRLVEVLRGRPYHAVLKEHLCDPAGMSHTVTLPEEAIMFRAAVGHMVQPPDLTPKRAAIWALPRAQTPAGSTPCSTVGDLLRFARTMMDGGGEVLSGASVAAMLRPQHPVPSAVPSLRPSVGLAWFLSEWRGTTEAGHTGSTLGQASALSTIPERGLAIAVLTNSLAGIALVKPLLDDLLPVFGVEPAPVPATPDPPADVDLTACAGTYGRRSQTIVVEPRDGRLVIATKATGRMAGLVPDLPPVTVTPSTSRPSSDPGTLLACPWLSISPNVTPAGCSATSSSGCALRAAWTHERVHPGRMRSWDDRVQCVNRWLKEW